jgi:hypothetical protein
MAGEETLRVKPVGDRRKPAFAYDDYHVDERKERLAVLGGE